MKNFPLFLHCENRSIVVFGGGADAAAKLRLVQKTDARLFVVAPLVDREVLELGTAIWVKSEPLDFELPSDLLFAYAATGNEELDAKIADRLRGQGALVCAVDQPEFSDFSTPAIVDRDPVVVAIGTQGTAPVLSRQIKASVEESLPASLGKIASAAGRLRATVANTLAPGRSRRAFWSSFFEAAPAQADSERGLEALGHGLIARQSAAQAKLSTANVDFIAVKSDQLADLGPAAKAALRDADVILHDGSVPFAICELARREAIWREVDPEAWGHVEPDQNLVVLRSESNAATVTWNADLSLVRAEPGQVQTHNLPPQFDAAKAAELGQAQAQAA